MLHRPKARPLRAWLGIPRETFYDARRIALLPMGLCYPGSGRSGDLPPRPECAATWRARLLARLTGIRLTVILGQYALAWHLPDARKGGVTQAVATWREHWPAVLTLPHPSPRNQGWLARNPWVEAELVPALRARVRDLLA